MTLFAQDLMNIVSIVGTIVALLVFLVLAALFEAGSQGTVTVQLVATGGGQQQAQHSDPFHVLHGVNYILGYHTLSVI